LRSPRKYFLAREKFSWRKIFRGREFFFSGPGKKFLGKFFFRGREKFSGGNFFSGAGKKISPEIFFRPTRKYPHRKGFAPGKFSLAENFPGARKNFLGEIFFQGPRKNFRGKFFSARPARWILAGVGSGVRTWPSEASRKLKNRDPGPAFSNFEELPGNQSRGPRRVRNQKTRAHELGR